MQLKSPLRNDSGASAVEFAIVAPLFILVLLSIVAYAIYFSAAVTVQELAADAARYSIAGVTNSERQTLARDYIQTATLNDPLVQRDKLDVTVEADPASDQQFVVLLTYRASNLPIWSLFAFALPSQTIRKSASIRIGGV